MSVQILRARDFDANFTEIAKVRDSSFSTDHSICTHTVYNSSADSFKG